MLTFRLWKVIIELLIDDSVEVRVSMTAAFSNNLQAMTMQGSLFTLEFQTLNHLNN